MSRNTESRGRVNFCPRSRSARDICRGLPALFFDGATAAGALGGLRILGGHPALDNILADEALDRDRCVDRQAKKVLSRRKTGPVFPVAPGCIRHADLISCARKLFVARDPPLPEHHGEIGRADRLCECDWHILTSRADGRGCGIGSPRRCVRVGSSPLRRGRRSCGRP